ncbi:hypothetical protein [Escherichia coli]|uniref:hypothetical protein n=1 Tax=Escherichia coli TaxID=562 RepID=UPI0011E9AA81|nr:hypothetical protein [Escherichia coli]
MIWQPEFTDKTLSRKPGAVHSVFFRRMDGRSGRVRIGEFNNLFEHIDQQEYRKILAGTEQEMRLKKLRAMQRR